MTKQEQAKYRARIRREVAEALKTPSPAASEAEVFAGMSGCPSIPSGYGINRGDCACGSCEEAK